MPPRLIPLLPGVGQVVAPFQAPFDLAWDGSGHERIVDSLDHDAVVPPLTKVQRTWATQLIQRRFRRRAT